METGALQEQVENLKEELRLLRDRVDIEHMPGKLAHLRDELANAVSHGVGAVFFIVSVPILVSYALQHSTTQYACCAAIFGFTLIITYLSSTLYHSIHHTETKRIMRIFDHASIFLLIGGSYTPVVYRYMPHDFAIPFLIVLWAIVGIGCIFKILYTGKFRLASTMVYVVLGFMVLFIIKPLTASMSTATIILLVTGGLSYAVGVPFYILKRLKYNHAVWHIFVFSGSILHFCVVLNSANYLPK
jgi:hemolysin III